MDLKTLTNSVPFVLGVFLAGPFGGMGIFALQKALRPRAYSERVQQAGGSAILNLWMKEYGYWWLRPQVRFLVWLGATPTSITVGGLAAVYLGCLATARGYFGLGGLIILIASLSDMLDGMVARQRNMCSQAGEFIDSVVDRYADLGLCAGLLAYYADQPAMVAFTTLAASGAMLVSYIRAKAESLGIWNVPSGLMQRAERAVYLGFGIFLSPVVAAYTEAPSSHPTYGLAIAAVVAVAVLTHISALRMLLFTVHYLRKHAAPDMAAQASATAARLDESATADASHLPGAAAS
jgi:phosphatidylglycerophosphate synthase